MLASPATESKHENWFIQAVSSLGPDRTGCAKIFATPVCDWKKRETREYYTRQGAQTAALHAVNKLIEQVSG